MSQQMSEHFPSSLKEWIAEEEFLKRSLHFYETSLTLLEKLEHSTVSQNEKNTSETESKDVPHQSYIEDPSKTIYSPPSDFEDENKWSVYLETLCKRLFHLQETLFRLNTQNVHTQQLLRRVIENRVAQSIFYSSENDLASSRDQKLREMLKLRDEKAKYSLQLHNELQKLYDEEHNLTQKIDEIKRSVREKWQKIIAFQQHEVTTIDRNKNDFLRIEKEVAYLEDQNTVVRHVFQVMSSNYRF
jgi:hypothetical protein